MLTELGQGFFMSQQGPDIEGRTKISETRSGTTPMGMLHLTVSESITLSLFYPLKYYRFDQ
jgi:hypothetical protein